MKDFKKTAKVVGILFVIGTVAGIMSLSAASIIHTEDYLNSISGKDSGVVLGALLTLIMGISLSMIPVILFPILRKYNEAVALGAVIFRGALELITYMGIASVWLLLLALSQKYAGVEMSEAANYRLMGSVLLDVETRFTNMLDIVFSIGALFIYYLFYQMRLIPTWISIWGLIGAALYLVYPILILLGVELEILQIPLAVQEMVMAGWLIIKGFKTDSLEQYAVRKQAIV